MTGRMIPASDVIATLRQRVAEGMPQEYADWCLDKLGIDPAGQTEAQWEHGQWVMDADGDLLQWCVEPCGHADRREDRRQDIPWWAPKRNDHWPEGWPTYPLTPLFTAEQVRAREQAAARQALRDAADDPEMDDSAALWLRERADRIGGTT